MSRSICIFGFILCSISIAPEGERILYFFFERKKNLCEGIFAVIYVLLSLQWFIFIRFVWQQSWIERKKISRKLCTHTHKLIHNCKRVTIQCRQSYIFAFIIFNWISTQHILPRIDWKSSQSTLCGFNKPAFRMKSFSKKKAHIHSEWKIWYVSKHPELTSRRLLAFYAFCVRVFFPSVFPSLFLVEMKWNQSKWRLKSVTNSIDGNFQMALAELLEWQMLLSIWLLCQLFMFIYLFRYFFSVCTRPFAWLLRVL